MQTIEWQDFEKVELRVGTIRSARPNEDTRFVYTLWPQSDGGDEGFDLLRFVLPGQADDIGVQIGGENIVPNQILAQQDSLLVVLPRPVKADSLQVNFTTRVVRNATVFGLDLGSSARPGLWQSVEAAERRANIVLLPELTGSARLIDDLRFSTPVLTPNGDGANDQVEISLVIFKVEATDPRVEIFDLSGRTVALLLPSTTGSTRATYGWPSAGILTSRATAGDRGRVTLAIEHMFVHSESRRNRARLRCVITTGHEPTHEPRAAVPGLFSKLVRPRG